MYQIEGVPDKGVYCWNCNKYYWYDDIKNNKCPEGHDIGG